MQEGSNNKEDKTRRATREKNIQKLGYPSIKLGYKIWNSVFHLRSKGCNDVVTLEKM